MKNVFLSILIILVTGMNAFADTQFTVEAPTTVAKGTTFNVTFKLVNVNAENLQMPNFNNFSVVGQTSFQNSSFVSSSQGMSVTQETNYVYTLAAEKEGTFTISPAKATAGGKTIMSNAVTIKVLPESQASQANQTSQAPGGGNAAQSSAVSDDDVFVRTGVSKKNMYEQEATVITYKLYIRLRGSIYDVKFPEYKGCVTQDVAIGDNQRDGTEIINGKKYSYRILKQTVLFPQKSGKLNIESGTVSLDVFVRKPIMTIFGAEYIQDKEQKTVKIPGTTIDVTPLPAGKPDNFSGGVGSFSLESSITKEEVKANDAVNLKLKISGNGNLKYLKTPDIKFPADFEIYDPKTDSKIKASTSGISGTKEIEYVVIPRFPGEFTIPSTEFSYFDTNTKQYKTLKTPEYHLKVKKSDNESTSAPAVTNYTNKEDVKFIGQDIRYINTKETQIDPKESIIYGTVGFWLSYAIPLSAFVILFIIYRKKIKENADIALSKNKKANKQARKRLNLAAKYLNENNKTAFYEEILKALWGYISDKLNIPLSELTKDNIEAELSLHGVGQPLINEFMELLHTYEFARFAPSESIGTMDDSYEKAVNLISQLEEEIKRKLKTKMTDI